MRESLSLITAAVAVAGIALGWAIRAWIARRHESGPNVPLVVEPDYLRREVSRLRSVEQRLVMQLAEKEALVSTVAAETELERAGIQAELEETRVGLGRLRQQLAEAEQSGGMAAAEARQLTAAKEAELRAARDRAADQALRAATERERDAKAIAEAETTRSLLATEALDLRRRLGAAVGTTATLQQQRDAAQAECCRLESALAERESDARGLVVAHQREIADRDAQIGALHAQVARNKKLQRRVEDREVLLRSVAAERDQATGAAQAAQRDLAAALERLRKEAAGRLSVEATAEERVARLAALEASVGRLTKERELHEIQATRAAGTIETLRAELRDRDVRFQALLADRRRVVEEALMEIARLRSILARNGAPPEGLVGNGNHRDDLKRISGIGPTLEKLLHDRGITSFEQIAGWTDQDIERISTELGSFRQRIRRDDWVGQARKALESGATVGADQS
jgi:predicted flap endonuclease-1-like 5' DNA nuclease